jgi:cellulose synthase/poly-beta-1,6-N-acetylglucosamine synthase-like glycosyltransferase/peptidoglycan/xylan/chitin deacetylase (PgdA/CDA1 family)
VLTVLLIAIFAALCLQGLTEGVGQARTTTAAGSASIPGGGSIISEGAHGLTSRGLPSKAVAFTFDDGPDPTWTPKVLAVLAREHVPATFFVVGTRAAQHPELVRQVLAGGHELGAHTWSHADLSNSPAWRRNLELSLEQLGLQGSAGVSSALLRPPYSSGPDALTPADVRVLGTAARAGYVTVLADRDAEDWMRPGVPRIVQNASPIGTAGTIVLMHDAGGDRSQTVTALPLLIQSYRHAGYRFTTVSGGLGLPAQGADTPVHGGRRLLGLALLLAVRVASAFTRAVQWIVLPLVVLVLVRTLMVAFSVRPHQRLSRTRLEGPEHTPPVSVLVPAYNEAVGIEAAVRSLAASDYPGPLEVLVIDDGSTDGTADLVRALDLPQVRVVSKPNGGKAAALITGTELAAHDVLVMLDGDTVFEPLTIRHLVQALRDPRVGAVSGNVKVGNRKGLLGRWQHLEYVVGFNLDRRLLDVLRCITCVPGAIGAFRRQALDDAGGMSTDTLAEDTDVTVGILRAGWLVVHEERARAWTEAPSSLGDLWKQRYRWAYGTLQVIWKHRAAMIEGGGSNRLGRVALPALLLFQVLLPLLAPVIDVYAIYGLLTGSTDQLLVVWGGYLAIQAALCAYALRLDGESLGPLWSLPLQQFVYRQIGYLVVIQSVVSALAGIRLPWQKLQRTGDVTVTA